MHKTNNPAPAASNADLVHDLNGRFGRPGVAHFDIGPGGLTCLQLTPPTASLRMLLHGAHVLQYQPAGHQPVLFVSHSTPYEPGKPVRGGVPICLPWFGGEHTDPQAPMHGLVRTRAWEVAAVEPLDAHTAAATFVLTADEQGRRFYPHDYEARFTVRVGPMLHMALRMRNTGSAPLRFSEALHTYLRVGDIHRATLRGLEGTEYLDKTLDFARCTQDQQPVTFTGETDRVYLHTRATCVVDDPALGRRIVIDKTGSDATVVWNPWQQRAAAMADLDDEDHEDGWRTMLCVETANAAEHAITLPPGAEHEMTATLRVEPLG